MLKTINDWLPWVAIVVLFIAQKVSSYYQYAKTNDPEAANAIKHVGELATWAVANQARKDKTGTIKFDDAVDDVKKQLQDTGITTATIEGAVQNAYNNSDLSTPTPAPVEVKKPEPAPIVVPKVTDPVEVAPIKPVEDNNAVLDDLEVKNE